MIKKSSDTSLLVQTSQKNYLFNNNPYESTIKRLQKMRARSRNSPRTASAKNLEIPRSEGESNGLNIKISLKHFEAKGPQSTSSDLDNKSHDQHVLSETFLISQTFRKEDMLENKTDLKKEIEEQKKKNNTEFKIYCQLKEAARKKGKIAHNATQSKKSDMRNSQISQNESSSIEKMQSPRKVLPKLVITRDKDGVQMSTRQRHTSVPKGHYIVYSERKTKNNQEIDASTEITKIYSSPKRQNNTKTEDQVIEKSNTFNQSITDIYQSSKVPKYIKKYTAINSERGPILVTDQVKVVPQSSQPSFKKIPNTLKITRHKSVHPSSQKNMLTSSVNTLESEERNRKKDIGNMQTEPNLQIEKRKTEDKKPKTINSLRSSPAPMASSQKTIKVHNSSQKETENVFEKIINTDIKTSFERLQAKISINQEMKKLNEQKISIVYGE